MNSPIVLNPNRTREKTKSRCLRPAPQSRQVTDPLSEVLALLKPHSYSSGGFALRGDVAVRFPTHKGIKCYAMLAGHCWLVVDGVSDPIFLEAGDCFLLTQGIAFRLATDPSLEPVHFSVEWARMGITDNGLDTSQGERYIAGGHFLLTGNHAEMLLRSLPPVVHIRRETDKVTLRWSLERMREELHDPQPGGTLIVQQLAYMMLIQGLRLQLTGNGNTTPGWLSGLSDKHTKLAITNMHQTPGYAWTLKSLAESTGLSRSVFAFRFREVVGSTPMEYLTQWRMLLAADRLKSSTDSISVIAQSSGYESEGAFCKAFRRVMGTSPRQYSQTSPHTV